VKLPGQQAAIHDRPLGPEPGHWFGFANRRQSDREVVELLTARESLTQPSRSRTPTTPSVSTLVAKLHSRVGLATLCRTRCLVATVVPSNLTTVEAKILGCDAVDLNRLLDARNHILEFFALETGAAAVKRGPNRPRRNHGTIVCAAMPPAAAANRWTQNSSVSESTPRSTTRPPRCARSSGLS